MALRLSIENVTNLPDGGPVSFNLTGSRSIDIGRDQHLDWTLPDPTRYISGKHCEIHWRQNSYWLHDVSTNGTFLYGADQRVRSPYELKDGDRIVIGQYIIGVTINPDGRSSHQAVAVAPTQQQHANYPEIWDSDRDVPPPVDRSQVLALREVARPVGPDFLDWAASVPEAEGKPARLSIPAPSEGGREIDWAGGSPPSEPPPETALPLANPRRPTWTDQDFAQPENNPFSKEQSKVDEKQNVAVDAKRLAVERASFELEGRASHFGSEQQSEERNFLRRVALSAGLADDFFDGKDPGQLADQLGALMRLSVGNLMSLLQARNEAKRLTRSTTHTTIQAIENNPLKFSPTAEDAMRILFGPKTNSYMEARKAFEQSFNDLKSHQLKTYAAMQHAVSMLIAEFDPAEITKGVDEQEGTLDKLRSRKGRQWDAFVTRWKASLGREPGAAIEAFMLHFADYYDKESR